MAEGAIGGAVQGETSADLRHLEALASDGSTGRLALRAGGSPLLEQLICAAPGSSGESLAGRFLGLHAALWADSAAGAAAGTAAGCEASVVLPSRPAPRAAAQQICSLLEVAPLPKPDAATEQRLARSTASSSADSPDMLILALSAEARGAGSSDGASTEPPSRSTAAGGTAEGAAGAEGRLLEWLDALVRELNQVPGFRETVLLTLVLGSGAVPPSSLALPPQEPSRLVPRGCAPLSRPRQSYEFAGAQPVSVDVERPALVVHRLAGVIRRDRVAALDPAEVARHGGGGAILAERMLPELAYKLGRAPKYGA